MDFFHPQQTRGEDIMKKENTAVPHHDHPEGKKENCSLCEISVWQQNSRSSWISRVFDAMGMVFLAVAIVLFFAAWMSEETKFYIALCVSFFISGLLYTAAGEVLRSTAETARNTSKLVQLKEIEIAEQNATEKLS